MGIFDGAPSEDEAERDLGLNPDLNPDSGRPGGYSDPNQPNYQDPTQQQGYDQNQEPGNFQDPGRPQSSDPDQPGYQDPTQQGYHPDNDPYNQNLSDDDTGGVDNG